jgi:hypothetical protein
MSVVIEYEKRVMKGCVIEMHSETCGYKDTDALLYALFDITDVKLITVICW